MLQLPPSYELWGIVAAFGLGVVAAITDGRSSTIPNWLTLPPILLAPVVYGVLLGGMAALSSVLGILVCGLPTLGLWLVQGGGGGDVKLGAAIGACAGLRAGFEIWLVSLVIAALFALGWLAWEGKLPQTLRNTFFLALNPMLPKQRRSGVPRSQMSTVRMGGAFLAATVLSLLIRHPSLAP